MVRYQSNKSISWIREWLKRLTGSRLMVSNTMYEGQSTNVR